MVALAAWGIPLTLATPVAQITPADLLVPNAEVAAQRGPQIFNAVFDSLRKWGAVTHRNGMSFMLATVPQNVLLYHGNDHNSTPTTLDWLAYEVEHAEMFARANHFGPPPPFDGGDQDLDQEVESVRDDLKRRDFVQTSLVDSDASDVESKHGWLHIYRTTRPLRFLYIDGMSGDKDDTGVLDTQDFLLRGVRDEPSWPPKWPPKFPPTSDEKLPGIPGEQNRVRDLCEMSEEWGLHGVIRTEYLGFEIIKCDFFDGMEQVQSLQRDDSNPDRPPWMPQPGDPWKPGKPGGPGKPGMPGRPGRPGMPASRDPEDRFRGVNPGRTILDYSSMVSALFFPIDVTNPDSEDASSPRLVGTTEDELAVVKQYLSTVLHGPHKAPAGLYDWRHVADEIVSRYTPKIRSMLNNTDSIDDMSKDIRFLLELFIDYAIQDEAVRDEEAEKRCVTFYIQTLPLETDADRLLYSAFRAVNVEICASFFRIRKLIVGDSNADSHSIESAKSILRSLIGYLAWHVFE